jgi:hypothetical protein
MRGMFTAMLLTAALASGCASGGGSQPTTAPSTEPQGKAISVSDLPTAIIAAFTAEHPYDKIHDPRQIDDSNGATRFLVPYTRPDGTEGSLTYAPTGEALAGY